MRSRDVRATTAGVLFIISTVTSLVATAFIGSLLDGPRFLAGVAAHQDRLLVGALFQLIAGLRYMFPRRMAAVEGDHPALIALHDRVKALHGIAAYLDSDRRQAFNEDGIFRHYPELDGE